MRLVESVHGLRGVVLSAPAGGGRVACFVFVRLGQELGTIFKILLGGVAVYREREKNVNLGNLKNA